MTREVREPDEPDSTAVILARFTGHGLMIALSTGLFLLLGWWVDGRVGSTPVFTILGALLGAAAGFYSLLQHFLFAPREREREEAERSANDQPRPPEDWREP